MNNFTMIDFNGRKNISTTKNEMRTVTLDLLYDVLSEVLGEENVSRVITDEKGTKEIAIAIGSITDPDGATVETCVTVKPTVKEYCERKTSTGKIIEMFDRFQAAKDYEDSIAEKERKTKEKEEEKKKKADKKKTDKE